MPTNPKSLTIPDAIRPRFHEICALIDAFCSEKLNAEYALLSKELAAKLARKRPSPLNNGQVKTWACAIVYAIGTINFLYDKSQNPHMRTDELCAWFGVASSTGASKSKQIRDTLRISQFDHQWILPSMLDEYPTAWMISVNGLVVDARMLPRSLQETAYKKGLIPYIPGAQESGSD